MSFKSWGIFGDEIFLSRYNLLKLPNKSLMAALSPCCHVINTNNNNFQLNNYNHLNQNVDTLAPGSRRQKIHRVVKERYFCVCFVLWNR